MPKKAAMEMPRIVSSPVISPKLEKGPIALDTSWRSKMRSIGIIYATREGQTRKVAKHIAADLCRHGFDASVKNVHDEFASIDLSVYDTVIRDALDHFVREVTQDIVLSATASEVPVTAPAGSH